MASDAQRQPYSGSKAPQPSLSKMIEGKVPPSARDLEEAVLGALMMDKELAIDMQEFLQEEHFYEPQHGTIFKAISTLVNEKVAVDVLTVSQKLQEQEKLEEVGGHTRLLQLTMKVASSAHAVDHAKIVIQKFLLRQMIAITSEIQHEAYNGEVDVEDLMETAESRIFELHESGMRKEILPAEVVVKETLDWLTEIGKDADKQSGVPSGFPCIDEITQGWQKSDLIILAARPSMGKTAFALTMARNIAMEYQQAIAFFSLEMSSQQLMLRLLTSETGINGKMLRSGRLGETEWAKLSQHGADIAEAHLYLDDSQNLGIGELRAKCRRLKSKFDVKLIIIDYLQLLRAPSIRNGNREQEVSMISRELKGIAKELEIPIIALAQLSRALESRSKGDKRPILSDLRESGSIEQDADLVLFIHRPERLGIEEFNDGTSTKGKAEIVIAKHRNGDTGSVFMDFIGEQTKFVDNGDRINHNSKDGESNTIQTAPQVQIYESSMNQTPGPAQSMPTIEPDTDLPF